jgi:hypothetical protein
MARTSLSPARLLFILALALPACSSEPGGGTTAKYTVDDVCDKVPPLTCAQRSSCCTQGGAFDEAGCEGYERARCLKNVTEVQAGRMRFDPDAVDACLDATKPYAEKCIVTNDELSAYGKDTAICHQIFVGQVGSGGACVRDEQCKVPSGQAYAFCEPMTKKCVVGKYLALGESCADPANLCDTGLYCDFAAGDMATCKKVTPVGQGCNSSQAVNFECGSGNYCDATTMKCTAGKAAGEACASQLECASLACAMDTMKCDPVPPIFDKELCTGAL